MADVFLPIWRSNLMTNVRKEQVLEFCCLIEFVRFEEEPYRS